MGVRPERFPHVVSKMRPTVCVPNPYAAKPIQNIGCPPRVAAGHGGWLGLNGILARSNRWIMA